jgi:hypothetical protein
MLSARIESMNTARIPEVRPEDAKRKVTELRVREEAARPRLIPKTHVAFWRARIERRTYEYEGKTLEVPEYSVRMKFGGIRKRLALGTALGRDCFRRFVETGTSFLICRTILLCLMGSSNL